MGQHHVHKIYFLNVQGPLSCRNKEFSRYRIRLWTGICSNLILFILYSPAIGILVRRITAIDDTHRIIRVAINHILDRGKVYIQDGRDFDLWTNSSCVCPVLKLNREYLVIGKEDVLYNRLMYTSDSLVTRWNTKWEVKVKVSGHVNILTYTFRFSINVFVDTSLNGSIRKISLYIRRRKNKRERIMARLDTQVEKRKARYS